MTWMTCSSPRNGTPYWTCRRRAAARKLRSSGLASAQVPSKALLLRRSSSCRSVVNTKRRRADWRMTGRPPSAEPVTRRAAISRARAVRRQMAQAPRRRVSVSVLLGPHRAAPRSGRSRPERAARRPAPDCYGAQRGRAAPELRGECSRAALRQVVELGEGAATQRVYPRQPRGGRIS